MRYISWTIRILLFLLLLGFALKNTDPVLLRFYLGTEWQAPLVVVLLVVFAVGATAGILATLGQVFRQRREILALRKQLRAQTPEEPRDS
jgi:lipopolysaccharide assembly protein A